MHFNGSGYENLGCVKMVFGAVQVARLKMSLATVKSVIMLAFLIVALRNVNFTPRQTIRERSKKLKSILGLIFRSSENEQKLAL